MSDEELLRCPFCGALADHGLRDESSEYHGGKTRNIVFCTQCTASVEGENADEARAAWNRRAG